MSHVFISYIRENEKIVDKLYHELKSKGIEIWLDRRDLGPGVRWKREIKKTIQQAAFFIKPKPKSTWKNGLNLTIMAIYL